MCEKILNSYEGRIPYRLTTYKLSQSVTEYYVVNKINCSTRVFMSSIPTFFDLKRNI